MGPTGLGVGDHLAVANMIEWKSAYARLLSPRGNTKNSYARKRVVRFE